MNEYINEHTEQPTKQSKTKKWLKRVGVGLGTLGLIGAAGYLGTRAYQSFEGGQFSFSKFKSHLAGDWNKLMNLVARGHRNREEAPVTEEIKPKAIENIRKVKPGGELKIITEYPEKMIPKEADSTIIHHSHMSHLDYGYNRVNTRISIHRTRADKFDPTIFGDIGYKEEETGTVTFPLFHASWELEEGFNNPEEIVEAIGKSAELIRHHIDKLGEHPSVHMRHKILTAAPALIFEDLQKHLSDPSKKQKFVEIIRNANPSELYEKFGIFIRKGRYGADFSFNPTTIAEMLIPTLAS